MVTENQEKNFRNKSFQKHDFSNQNLIEADFSGASLIECNFDNSDLSYATFDGANCTGSTFRQCRMYRTILKDTNLYKTVMDPRDFFETVVSIHCNSTKDMKMSRVWCAAWLYFLLIADIPNEDKVAIKKVIENLIGVERFTGLAKAFSVREL